MSKVKFLTVFRSVPCSAKTPSIGGDCWAAGTIQPGLQCSGKKWLEMEIYYYRLALYQDDQAGGNDGVGYNPDEDWYSFTEDHIVKWRELNSSKWRKGSAFSKYGAISKASREAKERAKNKERSNLVHNDVDYEVLLRDYDPKLALMD